MCGQTSVVYSVRSCCIALSRLMHDTELWGQEEAGRMQQMSELYLHVALL